MPKRVAVERRADPNLRAQIADWLKWLARKERLLSEGEHSPRLSELELLLEEIEEGNDVALKGDEIPASLNVKADGRFRLSGDRLVEI